MYGTNGSFAAISASAPNGTDVYVVPLPAGGSNTPYTSSFSLNTILLAENGVDVPLIASSIANTKEAAAYIFDQNGSPLIAIDLAGFKAHTALINDAGFIALISLPEEEVTLGSTGVAFVPAGGGNATVVTISPINYPQFYEAVLLESGDLIMAQSDLNNIISYIYEISGTTATISSTATLNSFQIDSIAVNGTEGYISAPGNQSSFLQKISIPGLNPQPVAGFPAGNYEGTHISIDSFGNAVIGTHLNDGVSAQRAAAFLLINGNVTEFTIPQNSSSINFSSVANFFGTLPPPGPKPGPIPPLPSGITSSNAALASYIMATAPEAAIYLIPSIMDGSINQALDSIAPSRNQVTSYTSASNQASVSSTTFASYLRNQQMGSGLGGGAPIGKLNGDQFVVSLDPNTQKRGGLTNKAGRRTAWLQGLGALSYQRAQQQIPAFNSSTAGFVAGVDQMVTDQIRLGAGATYMYTHLGQNGSAGFSNMNQEGLFVYGSWDNNQFYVDASFLAGMFQIHQIRNIQMTGFSFKATSNSTGWNIDPHLELGYSLRFNNKEKNQRSYNVNPFAMVDWANTWQNGYNETGASPFNMGKPSRHTSILRSEFGLRLYEKIGFKDFAVTFQEKGSYANVQQYGATNNTAYIVGAPSSFIVEPFLPGQNVGVAQAMILIEPYNEKLPSFSTFYQGEFNKQGVTNQVNLWLSWSF